MLSEADRGMQRWMPSRIGKPGEGAMEPMTIHAEREGGWMPAEDLRAAALAVLREERDVILNLAGVEHLDASALQILVALAREQKERGRQLELERISPRLREWFAYAGAAEGLLPEAGRDA